MTRGRFWTWMYWALLAAWLVAAALGMRGMHAGFVTSYLADLTQPAWLYVYMRGLVPRARPKWWLLRTIGRTPERAAGVLFAASTLTEISQIYWPRGMFRGRWDPYDVLAYGVGIGLCYAAERWIAPPLNTMSPAEG
ncbi:MAG: hypothetical protein ABI625_19710 [bacterium]